jgi:hypothetical protein
LTPSSEVHGAKAGLNAKAGQCDARRKFDGERSSLGSRRYDPTILSIALLPEQLYKAKIHMAILRAADMDGGIADRSRRVVCSKNNLGISPILAGLRDAIFFKPGGRTE